MGTAPDAVKRLVDRFDQNRKVFVSPDYKEEQRRAESPNLLLAAILLTVAAGLGTQALAGQSIFPVRIGAKFGYSDSTGRLVIPPRLDSAEDFHEGRAVVNVGGKYYPVQSMFEAESTFALGYWGFIDTNGQFVAEPQFTSATAFHDGRAAVLVGPKSGFVDRTGSILVPPRFGRASCYHEGLAAVESLGHWGFIDTSGRTVIPFVYGWADSFAEGLCPVESGGRWGYIDRTGKTMVPFSFDGARQFYGGVAGVQKGKKLGFIDRRGKWVIRPKFDRVSSFFGGPFRIAIDGKRVEKQVGKFGYETVEVGGGCGFIGAQGRVIAEPEFEEEEAFSEGFAQVKRKGKWGFIDTTGKYLVEPVYDAVSSFHEGLAGILDSAGWGFIDRTGKLVIENQFFIAGEFSEGRAVVYVDTGGGTYAKGCIDRTGKLVVPPRFARIEQFSEGLAFAELPESVGGLTNSDWIPGTGRRVAPRSCFIDTTGKVTLRVESYDAFVEFRQGLCRTQVEQNGLHGCIDHAGKYVIPPIYDDISIPDSGPILVTLPERWGFIDRDGRIAITPRMAEVSNFSEGLCAMRFGEKYQPWGGVGVMLTQLVGWPLKDGLTRQGSSLRAWPQSRRTTPGKGHSDT